MTFGRPILPELTPAPVATAEVDPLQAIGLVLAEYLRSLTFRVASYTTGEVAEFQFAEVLEDWPDAGRQLAYPAASVDGRGLNEGHNLTPFPLVDTWGVYDCGEGKTVLWKLAEVVTDLNVNVWTTSESQLDGILARLVRAFSPGEESSRVLLGGSPSYFDRPVRASLLEYSRMPLADAVYANERRARMVVRASIDVVELRCATVLDVETTLVVNGEER